MVDRQAARDAAADAIATRWEVIIGPRSGFGPVKTVTCGTYGGYQSGCRCADCLEARRTYDRTLAERKQAGLFVPKPRSTVVLEGITHGVRKGYEKGCRCGPCREAKSVSNRKNYRPKVDR
jgi:hypothetical protein